MSNKHPLYCSFCGKRQDEVATIVAGPTVFICDECVEICTEIILNERMKKEASDEPVLLPSR